MSKDLFHPIFRARYWLITEDLWASIWGSLNTSGGPKNAKLPFFPVFPCFFLSPCPHKLKKGDQGRGKRKISSLGGTGTLSEKKIQPSLSGRNETVASKTSHVFFWQYPRRYSSWKVVGTVPTYWFFEDPLLTYLAVSVPSILTLR